MKCQCGFKLDEPTFGFKADNIDLSGKQCWKSSPLCHLERTFLEHCFRLFGGWLEPCYENAWGRQGRIGFDDADGFQRWEYEEPAEPATDMDYGLLDKPPLPPPEDCPF